MTGKVVSLPLAELVEDMALYPRHEVDEANVAHLTQALKTGDTLPPIVADKESKRIVDGWHRSRAFRRVLGADAVVDVELRSYKSTGEMFLDAVALNATHGRRLDRIDEVRITILGEQYGLDATRIAAALHYPEERIKTLRLRVATVEQPGPGTVPGTQQLPLKRSMRHLAGSTLTKEQVAAHSIQAGVSLLLQVRQLHEALANHLVDPNDGRLRDALEALATVLAKYLHPPPQIST